MLAVIYITANILSRIFRESSEKVEILIGPPSWKDPGERKGR